MSSSKRPEESEAEAMEAAESTSDVESAEVEEEDIDVDDEDDEEEEIASVEVAVEADEDDDDEDVDDDNVAPDQENGVVADDSDEDEADDAVVHVVVAEDDDDEDDDDDNDAEEPTSVVAAEDDDISPSGDDDDDDDEPVLAAQVVADDDDDDDDDDEEENQVEASPKPFITPKKSKSSTKGSSSAKKRPASTGKGKAKGGAIKKSKRNKTRHSAGEEVLGISGERLKAANAAREILLATVPRLPVPVNENYTVRSFGQLHIEEASQQYSTPSALYPVGFSCDRYEFSPVHGRVIKMRCSILDGQKTNLNYNGPIFRVMWGQGVDEDVDRVEYPYNPYANSAPISASGDDVVAVPTTQGNGKANSSGIGTNSAGALSAGMKVKVRFENEQFYYGTIIEAEEVDEDMDDGKNQASVPIVIRYEDGSTEEAYYPDPDISLVMPGTGDEINEDGNVQLTELNGRPVTTTIGRTPLEAWSNFLIKLGLADEVIVDLAMSAVKASREEGFLEAKAKADGKKRPKARSMSDDAIDTENNDENAEKTESAENEENDEDAEEITEQEQALRDRVVELRNEMAKAKEEDEAATLALADARIGLLGPLLCNPFVETDGGKSHQTSWIAAAVRKEKAKMGSTGNKRKVVTATDLLERNNTFYSPEVESLLEGLPGSEYCTQYLYQANRGAHSASRQWLQEQKLLQERENKKRLKQSKEAKAKASLLKEKELKRKMREDERDARKLQKLEEEEDKKKARVEERLSRLRVQVDERLFKEAVFQREKVVLLLAKNLAKEFARRRKAAELLSWQEIDSKPTESITKVEEIQDLPPLSKLYDEDIVRIWDFIATFGHFFLERAYMGKLPSLDSLQTAIDTLRGKKTAMNKADATSFVTELAVSLCKPLSADLTRMLFASLIALNPALQKDFGAAFFNEVNSAKQKKDEEQTDRADVLLPVDAMTWKEIARVALQADALGELGYSRQDAAHLLRGYRSAGHPNSKEARRLRRVEDFSIALLRQTLHERQQDSPEDFGSKTSVHIRVPTNPSVDSTHWLFYLHNVISAPPSSDQKVLLSNLSKAIELIRANGDANSEETVAAIEATKVEMEGARDLNSISKVKEHVAKIIEKSTGEVFSKMGNGAIVKKEEHEFGDKADLMALEKLQKSKVFRARMGELHNLTLTQKEFKDLARIREEYMSNALELKEEMKRQEMEEAGEDDDDDDDDDDDLDGSGKKESEKATTAEIVEDDQKKDDEAQPGSVDSAGVNKGANADATVEAVDVIPQKIGKETPHDDFCGDIPSAPELIRRCLAVLRTLSQSGPAEPFLYPVDPQTNPGYYDMLLRPMCMREVGLLLQQAAKKYADVPVEEKEHFVERTVADFARNVRLIGSNCLSYANAGPTVISAGGEMLRIFERLLLDWILAPKEHLMPLEELDDDLCVDPHPTDADATVLLCDGCEGNFNISRLDRPLLDIPKGDWHCPRCLNGRWWGDLDPRIGKEVALKELGGAVGTIRKCYFCHLENETPSLMYEIHLKNGVIERATLESVDNALKEAGTPVDKIRCLEAVAESRGYGAGVDHGLRPDLVPVPLNPKVSDAASQVALSSSVFRDSIAAASALLIGDVREMTANEWVRLLSLLIMKCSSSDVMQNVASEMENEAAERLAKKVESISKVNNISQVLPELTEEYDDNDVTEVVSSNGEAQIVVSAKPETEERNKHADVKSENTAVVQATSEMIVEASAVQVDDRMDVDGVPSQPGVAYVEAEAGVPDGDDFQEKLMAAVGEKARRQRAREDGIAAFCIKNQLRSTVASFEQDNVSMVVESTLATKEPGLTFAATRCRGVVCDFCGLSDTALGTNLVRIPNADEWNELVKHSAKSRKTHLVADLEANLKGSAGSTDKKLVSVTIRVGDDLVSDDLIPEEPTTIQSNQTVDGGMLEFMPRNPDGFQDELRFRYESGLPFVSGSLTGHDCCGVAAHNSRKVKVVQDVKDRLALQAELEEGSTCGRTLELGRDKARRSYWAFKSDPESLFVCHEQQAESGTTVSQWHKYSEPEAIASVMVSLGKDPIIRDLKRTFPKARKMLKDGTWSELLMKRHFKLEHDSETPDSPSAMKVERESESESDGSYKEGTKVLLQSKDKSRLWDAEILAVAKNADGKVTGYRVHYTRWSTRFDEWVSVHRVLPTSEDNRETQVQLVKDTALLREGMPSSLEAMEATKFLQAQDRARGNRPLPDFGKIASVGPGASEDEKIFATMKAAMLAIEAALPLGSVNHTERGEWRPAIAYQWSRMVQEAEGPWTLMRCIILLEDTISEEWIKEQIGNLRACLPNRWKALEEASASSLAMRILLLDRALMYGTIDKRRYRESKSKK